MEIRTLQDCRDIILRKTGRFPWQKALREKIRCLEALIEYADFQELPLIFRCLRDESAAMRDKACQGVRILWGKEKHLNNKEDRFKGLLIEPEDLDYFRIDFGKDLFLILLSIASLNRDGFVREKAVKELGRLKTDEGLKFVLHRLGDWVLQVRLAALTATRAYLTPEYVTVLTIEFPLIDRLLEIKRTDLAAVHREIVQFILDHASPADVSTFKEPVRLRYFRYYLQRINFDEQLAAVVFTDSNYLIRLLVLNQVWRFSTSFQKSILHLALKDRATPVRIKAIDKARQFLPDLSGDMQFLLLDKAYSVREFTRTLLMPTGMDYIGFYRDQIETGASVPGGVMGLCDIGGAEDLDIYKKFVSSPKAVVSLGCLLALNRHDPQSAIAYALDMLGHRSGVVRKAAIRILAKQATRETLQRVRKRYEQGNLRIKRAGVAVFKRVGGWPVLPDLIDSLSDEHPEVRRLGWQLLTKWRADASRLFTQPDIRDLERARRSLENVVPTYKKEWTVWQEEIFKQIAFFIR